MLSCVVPTEGVQPTLSPELAVTDSRRVAEPEGVPQPNPRLLHIKQGTAGALLGTTSVEESEIRRAPLQSFRSSLEPTSVSRHSFVRDSDL